MGNTSCACSAGPVPEDMLDLVGTWRTPTFQWEITRDGKMIIQYEFHGKNYRCDCPVVEFGENYIEIRWFMWRRDRLEIQEWPHVVEVPDFTGQNPGRKLVVMRASYFYLVKDEKDAQELLQKDPNAEPGKYPDTPRPTWAGGVPPQRRLKLLVAGLTGDEKATEAKFAAQPIKPLYVARKYMSAEEYFAAHPVIFDEYGEEIGELVEREMEKEAAAKDTAATVATGDASHVV